MKLAVALVVSTAALCAQTPKNPLIDTSKGMYGMAKTDILKSADKVPEAMWSFKPSPDVRTMGQVFAHVADAQYEFCSAVTDAKPTQTDVEKTAKTKDEIVAAIKTAFAYCDAAYAKLNDGAASEIVTFFGMKASRLGILDFNIAHTFEHYGNLVTYMRIKGIVPPSSEGQK
jgi:uncharacterized damage-inducible protein DinB